LIVLATFLAFLALATAANDVDALRARAMKEYWSGDFRSAQRDFATVLRARPDDAEVRKALQDLATISRPVIAGTSELVSDDQPLRRSMAAMSYTRFSDPLTKWTATAGGGRVGGRDLPFAGLGVDTKVGPLHGIASLRFFRFPDGRTEPLGGFEVAYRRLSVAIDRHELLYTASSLRAHPSETTASLAWKTDDSAATLRAIRYFDRNHGQAADAWHLAHVTRFFSAGAAASYRDTDESRFNGALYDPYWTPRNQLEARAIIASTLHARRMTINLHADGGWGRDELRTFHPWRAFAEFIMPLRGTFAATAAIERQSTAFYRANAVRLGFSGRL
jgi:hypothetical protein